MKKLKCCIAANSKYIKLLEKNYNHEKGKEELINEPTLI